MGLEGAPLKLNEGTAEKNAILHSGSKQVKLVTVLSCRWKTVKAPQSQAWIDLLDLIRGHMNCSGV